MIEFYTDGGPGMHLMLVIGIVIIYLTVRKSVAIFIQNSRDRAEHESGVNAILFWGVISLIFGFFWHYYGMYLAMEAIRHARDISPGIVAHGYQQSLISVLTGFVLFLFGAVAWFVLRGRLLSRTPQ